MNSIHHVGDAIAYEINRQIDAINSGDPIVLHTRLWDPEKHVTTAMRAKFEGPCIPDPSVPLIVLTDTWLEKMTALLPEMPGQKVKRFVTGLFVDPRRSRSHEHRAGAFGVL